MQLSPLERWDGGPSSIIHRARLHLRQVHNRPHQIPNHLPHPRKQQGQGLQFSRGNVIVPVASGGGSSVITIIVLQKSQSKSRPPTSSVGFTSLHGFIRLQNNNNNQNNNKNNNNAYAPAFIVRVKLDNLISRLKLRDNIPLQTQQP